MSCPECIKDLFPATTSNSAAERISKCNLSWFFSGLQLHVMNLVRRIYYCGRNKSLSPHRWDSCIGSCISRLQHLEPLQPGQSPVLRFSALLGSVLLPEPSLTGRGIWCSWAVVSKPTLSQNTSCEVLLFSWDMCQQTQAARTIWPMPSSRWQCTKCLAHLKSGMAFIVVGWFLVFFSVAFIIIILFSI